MKTESFRQVELLRRELVEDQMVNTRLTCLVEDRPDIRVGNQLTLKDSEVPHARWHIMSVSQAIPRHAVHRTWNNNI